MGDSPLHITFDRFMLDEANAQLTDQGRAISLPPKAFAVLCTLVRQPRQLVSKDALLDAVWGHRFVSESVLKNTVSQLRAALADDAGEPRFIETVSRRGYRFIGAPTAALVAAPTATSSAPMTAELPAMVGRRDALARLHADWQCAQSGERRLIWIEGEAGIGKTTLVDRFEAEIGAHGTVRGQCVEQFGAGEPYLPILEALKFLARRTPSLAAIMRQVAPTWLMQMPWLIADGDRGALQAELAGAGQERMVREFWELMERVSQQTPLLLITEDLHWSDQGTLQLMDYFARRRGALHVAWVATFRLTQVIAEEHPLQRLRQELRLHRLCEEIPLDTFSESEVAEYLRSKAAGDGIPEKLVKALHTHTEGLPLFLASVVASVDWNRLSERNLPIPDNLIGAIDKQLSSLPAESLQVLEAASVAGTEFGATAVADLLGREAEWVTHHCDELARRGLWLRHAGIVELEQGFDSRYGFQHALYLHVCYQRLPASQRVQMHRRMAIGLQRRREQGAEIAATELASHYERGHETLAALRAYALAAQNALAHYAPKDAEPLIERAIALLARCPDSPTRQDAELELMCAAGVTAQLLHGLAADHARRYFDRARTLGEQLPKTPRLARSLNGLGWVSYVCGDFVEALRIARSIGEVAEGFDDALLRIFACNLGGCALISQAQFAAGCAELERGLALCRALTDPIPPEASTIDPETSMRLNVCYVLFDRGLADAAQAHLSAARVRAVKMGQPAAMMLVNWVGAMLEIRAERPEAVARHVAELKQVVEAGLLGQGEGPALWLRGWVEAMNGEPQTGYQHIKQGFERHARIGMYAGCPEVQSYAVEALIMAQDWSAAQRELDETLALAERIGERIVLVRAHMLGARIALGRKDRAAARRALQLAVATAQQQQVPGLELKAQLALAELDRRNDAVRIGLAQLLERITEGRDLPVYRRATQLLAGAL